jgi:hypothetical protein
MWTSSYSPVCWTCVSCFICWFHVFCVLCRYCFFFTESSITVGMLSCFFPMLEGNSYIARSRLVILRVCKVASVYFVVYLHILRKSIVVIFAAHDTAQILYYVSIKTCIVCAFIETHVPLYSFGVWISAHDRWFFNPLSKHLNGLLFCDE